VLTVVEFKFYGVIRRSGRIRWSVFMPK